MSRTRSHVEGNQLIALEEIIELSMKDPRIRAILADCDLNRLITHYDEPDLLISTVKALGSVEYSSVHRVWAPILSLCIANLCTDHRRLLECSKEDIFKSLRYSYAHCFLVKSPITILYL